MTLVLAVFGVVLFVWGLLFAFAVHPFEKRRPRHDDILDRLKAEQAALRDELAEIRAELRRDRDGGPYR